MTEQIVSHSCGFKFCKSTLGKTNGKCPKCGAQLIPVEEVNSAMYGGK